MQNKVRGGSLIFLASDDDVAVRRPCRSSRILEERKTKNNTAAI